MRDVQKHSPARSVRSNTSVDALPEKRSVSLLIAGQRLSIRSDKDEEYLQNLAAHVNGIIDDLQNGARHASTQQIFLLAALNMADELFQAQDLNQDLRAEVERRTERLIRMLDGADAGDEV